MNEGIEASVPLALTLNVCMNVRFWEHIQTKLLFGRTMSHVPTMAARFILLFSKPRAASAFPSRSHTTPDHIVGGRLEPTSCSEKWEGGGSQRIYPSLFSWRFSYLGRGPFRSRWLLHLRSARSRGVGPADACLGLRSLALLGPLRLFSRQPTASSQFKAHLYMLSIQPSDHFNRSLLAFTLALFLYRPEREDVKAAHATGVHGSTPSPPT